jgi:hypothetical protein
MGLAMGVNNLVDIFDEILPPFKRWNFGSFGKLFYRDMKVFYPMIGENGEIIILII